MAWHSVPEPWLNHAEVHVAMWAGQRVLCLLQNLFKQNKLSLPPILARDKCWGSCSDYNWDPWAPRIALHASRNVPRHLKRLETVQAIEHTVVVNGCKNSGNSYYWSQVTTLLIRRSMNSPYTFSMAHRRSFTPALVRDVHYASQPLSHKYHLFAHVLLCFGAMGLIIDNDDNKIHTI